MTLPLLLPTVYNNDNKLRMFLLDEIKIRLGLSVGGVRHDCITEIL